MNGFSQNAGLNIKGKIADINNTPVEYVNILLLRNDSSLEKGTNSDLDGQFTLTNLISGQYILKINCLGYLDTYITLPSFTKDLDLGTLTINENTQILKEIVIYADKTIEKTNKQIWFPDAIQIKTSTQGFDLLSKMQIPDIIIDGVNRNISALDRGNVQLRINGRKSDINDLSAIRPDNILRIDFYNMPGARYGNENVSAVIDVILKEKRTGGYVMTDLMNATFTGFGNDQWVTKINHKDSEFGFSYALNYRGYKDRWANRDATFNFPGNPFEREIKGIKAPLSYQVHNLNFSYDLVSKDKLFLNVMVKDEILNHHNQLENLIHYSNKPEATQAKTQVKTKSQTPVVDAYLKYKLSPKQSIAINVVGTYINTNYNRNYLESEAVTLVAAINNVTDGKKYSYISELIYEKELNNGMNFSAGAQHSQGHTKNTYSGNINETTEMDNTNSYIYTDLGGTYKQLGYSAGIGLTRVWFDDRNNSYTYYSFRPSVQLSYKFHKNFSLRYSFIRSTEIPTLDELSDIRQAIDNFYYSKGNHNLQPYNILNNMLVLNYQRERVGANLTLRYRYYDNPIMETICREENKMISISENQPKFQQSGGFINLKVEAIKNIWRLNLIGGANYYQSDGNSYLHHYHNYWGAITSNFIYKDFDLNVVFYSRRNSLWGETIRLSEDNQSVDIGYKYNNIKFGIGVLYPFKNEWSGGYENLSNLMREKSWTYIKDNGHMLYLRFSWNFSYGKKSKSFTKDLNNSDNDSGIRSLDKQ
jgi:hypothetical protein